MTNASLEAKLQSDPNAVVNLIVRVKEVTPARVSDLQARGITVRYTYSLTNSLAIQGPASAMLALMQVPWVVSIEEDKPVHTM